MEPFENLLSRAKRTDGKGWVHGYYVRLIDSYKGKTSHRIYRGYAEVDNGDFYGDWFEVDPETLGRCTGMRDISGTLVYQDDIAEVRSGSVKHGRGVILYDADAASFCYKYGTDAPLFFGVGETITVIGNIYDNPELVEVQKNG